MCKLMMFSISKALHFNLSDITSFQETKIECVDNEVFGVFYLIVKYKDTPDSSA